MTPREEFVAAMRLVYAALSYTEFQKSGREELRKLAVAFADVDERNCPERIDAAHNHERCRTTILRECGLEADDD